MERPPPPFCPQKRSQNGVSQIPQRCRPPIFRHRQPITARPQRAQAVDRLSQAFLEEGIEMLTVQRRLQKCPNEFAAPLDVTLRCCQSAGPFRLFDWILCTESNIAFHDLFGKRKRAKSNGRKNFGSRRHGSRCLSGQGKASGSFAVATGWRTTDENVRDQIDDI